MITVEQITEQELWQLKNNARFGFWARSFLMVLVAAGFGLIFRQILVAVVVSLIILLIFFIVSRTPVTKGNMKIIRRNKVIDARLERSGVKVTSTTINLILAADNIPAPYTQTDTFMVYHSWGHLSDLPDITPHNYKQLIGREVEITYMADTGFVLGLNTDPHR